MVNVELADKDADLPIPVPRHVCSSRLAAEADAGEQTPTFPPGEGSQTPWRRELFWPCQEQASALCTARHSRRFSLGPPLSFLAEVSGDRARRVSA